MTSLKPLVFVIVSNNNVRMIDDMSREALFDTRSRQELYTRYKQLNIHVTRRTSWRSRN